MIILLNLFMVSTVSNVMFSVISVYFLSLMRGDLQQCNNSHSNLFLSPQFILWVEVGQGGG